MALRRGEDEALRELNDRQGFARRETSRMHLLFWLPRLDAKEIGYPAFIVFIGFMQRKLKRRPSLELPHK
jgi:hypothetical protein